MKRRIIPILLIISILTTTGGIAVMPTSVKAASPASVITQAGGCIGSAALSSWLSGIIDSGLKALQDKIKNIASQYVRNLLGSLMEGLLGSSVPVSAKDQSMLSYFQNKDYRDAVIARCIARQILDNITNNTATIIKTRGRDGGSTFVTNWTTFLTQAQYRGENIFRAELSTAQLCDYLSDGIKKSFGVDPKKKTPLTGQNTRTDSLQPFSLSAKCTMPVGWTPQKYQQDFAGNGGWDAYSRMLEPQNNAWGLAALSQDEIAKQRALQQTADTTQVTAGRGYTGISGISKADSCRIVGPTGECLVYKDIKTTGDYLANSTAAAIGAEYSWLTTAQGLNTVIENITQNMINRLFDQSDNTGGTLNPAQDAPAPPPTPDGGGGVPPPPDADVKHGNHAAEVSDAKTTLAALGRTWVPDMPTPEEYECNRFEITNNAAKLIPGAGILEKTGGTNCRGYSVDIIVFEDGYIYDVLSGNAPDGANPTWGPVGCGPTGGNGTCPDRYRQPITYP